MNMKKTSNIERRTLNAEGSELRCSMFDVRRSAFSGDKGAA